MVCDARQELWDGQRSQEYQAVDKTHLFIEVCSCLGVGDLRLQEGAGPHLDVHHTGIVEVIQQVLHFNEV